jgi:hypothetical protein
LYNLKNLLHGTVGFISQISNQIFLMKELPSHISDENFKNRQLFEFSSKKFSSYDKRDKDMFLVGSVNLKKLSSDEKNILSNKFRVNCDMASCGNRVSIKSQIFHSLNYKEKGSSNSYTISYISNDEIKYGKIHYFLEYDNCIYCIVNTLKFLDTPKDILPESSGFFYEIVFNNLFKFYKLVSNEIEEDIIDIIKCNQLRNRCFIVENEKRQNFLCEIPTFYKHD